MPSSRRKSRGYLSLAAGIVLVFVALADVRPAEARSRRELAARHYRSASAQLEKLRSAPEASLEVADLASVANRFRKVYYTSPVSGYCDDALLHEANLYREISERFGSAKYRSRAIRTYQFLIREYPHSKLKKAAREAVAEIKAGRTRHASAGPSAGKKTPAQKNKAAREASSSAPPAADPDDPKMKLAETHYRAAAQLLKDLQAVPEAELGFEQYELVANAFGKVLRVSRQSPYSDESILHAAKLFEEIARRFSRKSYRERAADAYATLIREYPNSGLIEQAREALAALGAEPVRVEAPASQPAQAVVRKASLPSQASAEAVPNPRPLARSGSKEDVRFWSHPKYTRVVVELEEEVPFRAERLSGPDRLFFDLDGIRLERRMRPEFAVEVDDALVRRVRLGQFKHSVARIVFDLKQPVNYHATWLPNPPRFVVELRPKGEPVPTALTEASVPPVDPAAEAAQTGFPSASASAAERGLMARARPASGPGAAQDLPASRPVQEAAVAASRESSPDRKPAPGAGGEPSPRKAVSAKAEARSEPEAKPASRKAAPPEKTPAEPERQLAKLSESPALPQDLPSPQPASATTGGKRNLIRALGLKVGSVVIDPGHGGRDTGSIGPSGLQEKDLVLDIAQRLGKLLKEKLGSRVTYTRTEDRFVSLKQRTAIANEAEADLFISIHANSSNVRSVRGVETYYLNFTTNSWAMKVASRENASSQRAVHELRDLISKIALTEKIEESREFAIRVQQALYEGLSQQTKGLRNRGVRKAPFMVLIGARMPAVLAEIGFLSNAKDEKLLKTAEYRQKVAQYIFDGVYSYAETLGNVSVAQSRASGGPQLD